MPGRGEIILRPRFPERPQPMDAEHVQIAGGAEGDFQLREPGFAR